MVEKNRNQIKKLCEQYRVKTFFADRVLMGKDLKEDPDLGFIVDFEETDPFKYTDLYFQLKESLEKLLNRKINLIEERGIKNQILKKELESTKALIYRK